MKSKGDTERGRRVGEYVRDGRFAYLVSQIGQAHWLKL